MSISAEKFAKKKSSFVSAIIKEKALVYDLRFIDDEQSVYFILEVDRPKHKEFLEKLDRPEPIELAAYGKILYSGYGEPTDLIKEELAEKFGMY